MKEGKTKVLFPDGLERIEITKDSYDRLYGDMTLENIELKEEIERLKDKILSLENERDILKSTLLDTKADIKYLLQHGENIYIRRKYIRGEIDE